MNTATCVLNLGLKSMRAAVFDSDGARLAIAYRPIESRMGEGRVEQDPADWWRAALDTLDEVLADRVLAQRVRRLTATASAGCLVAMDAAGDPLRPAIMISDVRSREEAERISREPTFLDLGLAGGRVTRSPGCATTSPRCSSAHAGSGRRTTSSSSASRARW
jgi:sugar (pentulose or hexulose) kinase